MARFTGPIPAELINLLARLDFDEKEEVKLLFQKAFDSMHNKVQLIDLWDQPDLALTNWVLLLTGVNQEEELEIAKTLLFWKAFFAKDSSRVLCIQSSEHRGFRCCTRKFGTVSCPTLVLSDTPEMNSFIKIGPQLLYKLTKDKGGLQRFLTRLHISIENGKSLEEIEKELRSEKFWASMKIVYNEVKGLLTFNFNAKADV